MFPGGSVDPTMAHLGVTHLGTTCCTSQLLEQSMQGQGVEAGVVGVLVVPLEACLCKPVLPRAWCLLPQVIAEQRMGSAYPIRFRLAWLCWTGLAGHNPGKVTGMWLLLWLCEALCVLGAE